jgi:hypothetical protein
LTSGSIIVKGNKINHLDDLAALEEVTDPMFMMIALFKEQVIYSFSGFFSKIAGSLPSLPADRAVS